MEHDSFTLLLHREIMLATMPYYRNYKQDSYEQRFPIS